MTGQENLPRAVKQSLKSRHGCFVSVFAFLSLAVLALPVGLARSWQAWPVVSETKSWTEVLRLGIAPRLSPVDTRSTSILIA